MSINPNAETINTVAASPTLSAAEVVIGRLVGIDNSGRPLVSFALADFQGNALVALSTQALRAQDVGRQLALLFAGGQAQNPVIMGFIHSPLTEMLEVSVVAGEALEPVDPAEPVEEDTVAELTISRTPLETRIDGKRVVFAAEEEVVIQCGEASISLTKNGKVTIRGKYLLSRASGVNRILGGSVQVN